MLWPSRKRAAQREDHKKLAVALGPYDKGYGKRWPEVLLAFKAPSGSLAPSQPARDYKPSLPPWQGSAAAACSLHEGSGGLPPPQQSGGLPPL